MGCDIHCIAQVREADGAWRTVAAPEDWPRDEYDTERLAQYEREGRRDEWYWSRKQEWLRDRHYALFSILANVRNFYSTPDWPSITDRRGVPEGLVVDEYLTIAPECLGELHYKAELGDHSVTWMTLQEILDYPWATTQVEYSIGPWTAAQACEWFLTRQVPAMQRYCEARGLTPSDFRLVMGFDS